jgi:hypothetical protein
MKAGFGGGDIHGGIQAESAQNKQQQQSRHPAPLST